MSDISIAVMFDPICPWCYIGKRRLGEAMAKSEHNFSISYLPFQLNPTMDEAGMDRQAYLQGKFGGKQQAKQAYAPIYATADSMGLDMRLDDIKRTPNTLKAHSVLQYLQEQNDDRDFGEILLRAYLCEAQDIGDESVLQTLSGLDSIADIVAKYGDSVMQSQMEAAKANLHGVPFYIIDKQYGVSGAQQPEAFLQIFAETTKNR